MHFTAEYVTRPGASIANDNALYWLRLPVAYDIIAVPGVTWESTDCRLVAVLLGELRDKFTTLEHGVADDTGVYRWRNLKRSDALSTQFPAGTSTNRVDKAALNSAPFTLDRGSVTTSHCDDR